ncbi:MAG TPA: RagB/SusD family nutrient uptake outer membrane protein [Sphingobacterium sp.]|nr:RagB/SusD family nutrient uptake outer membrane protein [Sphingobacterium sp.]
MKNILRKTKAVLLTGVVCMLFSCEKILEVNPTDSVDATEALTSKEGFQTATVGVYSILRKTNQYGRQLVVYPEILGNNAAHSGRGTNLINHSTNARGSHMTPWRSAYEAIAQINIILTELEAFEEDPEWKKSIAGQLHFLRALFFHNVAKVYSYDPTGIGSGNRGTVPLNLTPVYSYDELENLERASQEDLYTQLYDDLTKAYDFLENTPSDRAPHWASQGAAAALFSRVALYNGDYPKVVEEVEKALASEVGKFSTHSSYISDWRQAVHPESIFELEIKTDQNIGANNAPRADYTNRAGVGDTETVSGRGNAKVSDELYAMYSDEDVRKQLIVKGLGAASDDNQITKFYSRSGELNLDNIPIIRVSELYLNRAEAYSRMSGMEDEAMEDVNIIRERAGLEPVSGLTEDNLIDEIFKQRRLELAFEGHNFFDYKRLGMDIIKPGGKVFPFSDYRVLARIPWREFNANKELRQNRGY